MCKVATWQEAGMREESMMKLVNMHWKPVYINCGPCKQRCFLRYICLLISQSLTIICNTFNNFRYDIIMKMETLSRDTQYLKVSFINSSEHHDHIMMEECPVHFYNRLLAQNGALGVKMLCVCLSVLVLGQARNQTGKQAGKHLEDIQSEPCPVGAC